VRFSRRPRPDSKDREVKRPLYAHYSVPYAWLIDPGQQTLEVYRLDDSTWVESGFFSGTDQVTAPPFEAVSIDPGLFWPPRGPSVVWRFRGPTGTIQGVPDKSVLYRKLSVSAENGSLSLSGDPRGKGSRPQRSDRDNNGK